MLSFRPYTFGMPFQGDDDVDDVDDALLEILDSVHRRSTLASRPIISYLHISLLGAMKHHRILMKVRWLHIKTQYSD